jgi:hypothetical protein
MSTETAQLVLAIIAGVGFIAWLAGFQFLFNSARVSKTDAAVASDFNESLPEGWMVGSAEVEGRPAVLAKRATALLVKQSPGPFGAIKIVEAGEDRLVFERVGPAPGGGQTGQWLRRGEMRFTAADAGRTRIDYAIERSPLRILLWIGALFLVLGLIALVVGAVLIGTLVVPSPDPRCGRRPFRWCRQSTSCGRLS